MAIKLAPDFKEFLRLLRDHGVRHLVIGGYAVAYHGYPRATDDLDIWVSPDPANAMRTFAALRAFGFAATELSPELFQHPSCLVRMGRPPLRIDVLTTISGVAFEIAYARRVTAVIDGVKVDVLSLEDLKSNKQASGRHRDLADLDELP
jgi:predicted nucleotidyltransferase